MNVAVVSPEPLGKTLSGIGIRMLNLARVISEEYPTTLFIPEGSHFADQELDIRYYKRDRIAKDIEFCQIVLVQGEPANFILSQNPNIFSIVDLYDPYPVEALNYGMDAHRFSFDSFRLQLSKGHLFLCASREQKLFYSGALYHTGRISPDDYLKDKELDNLLLVVPFGVPESPPERQHGWLRERLSVSSDEPLVFFGGIYDWYDGDFLLSVWRKVTAEIRAHLIVCRHPRPETTPQSTFRVFQDTADELGMLNRSIHIIDWVPYEKRLEAYGDCLAALSFHHESFETCLSFRTRVLDFLWSGLPVLSSPGGGLQHALSGLPGLTFLQDTEVRTASSACIRLLKEPIDSEARNLISRSISNRFSWNRTTAPLMELLHRLSTLTGREKPSLWRRLFS